MPSNAVAVWLGALLVNATAWEVAAALVGIAACGYAAWGGIDNLFDLRAVRDEGIDGDPRGITARFLLTANILFLLGWMGYTHVALTAAYLPGRADVAPSMLNDISVMRLGYAMFGLLGQATLRHLRFRLRSLTRDQWDTVFGDVAKVQALYHASQAHVRRLQAEVAMTRAEKHDALQQSTRDTLKIGMLTRLIQQHGIEISDALKEDRS